MKSSTKTVCTVGVYTKATTIKSSTKTAQARLEENSMIIRYPQESDLAVMTLIKNSLMRYGNINKIRKVFKLKEQFRDKKYTGNLKITYKVEEDGSKIKKVWESDQRELILNILRIVEDYQNQNIIQTLRGYYYDLVSEGLIPNAIEIYKRIGKLISDLRYSGHIDWKAMEDRARKKDMASQWENVADLMNSAVHSYRLPRWENQNKYIELFTEKDTMYSRLAPLTKKYHIPLCINRGYASSSVIYDLSKRILDKLEYRKQIVLLYVGDHDPSGLDMINDIEKRLTEFLEDGRDYYDPDFKIIHVALTKDQIEKYKLPPNPAKVSDPRAKWYMMKHGNISWEVDAMKPQIMREIVEQEILKHVDMKKYNSIIKKENIQKEDLKQLADDYVKKSEK